MVQGDFVAARKIGKYFESLSCTLSLPCSCSFKMAEAVNCLVMEPMRDFGIGDETRPVRDIGEAVSLLEKDLPVPRDQYRRSRRVVREEASEERVHQFVPRGQRGVGDGAAAGQHSHHLRFAVQARRLERRHAGFGLRIYIQALRQQILDSFCIPWSSTVPTSFWPASPC